MLSSGTGTSDTVPLEILDFSDENMKTRGVIACPRGSGAPEFVNSRMNTSLYVCLESILDDAYKKRRDFGKDSTLVSD